ncbi:MAG: PaaI family thioesterase [Actinobacteria bacterium]|nr:PaaI family thioesterase [Actinomycetota bacterium]
MPVGPPRGPASRRRSSAAGRPASVRAPLAPRRSPPRDSTAIRDNGPCSFTTLELKVGFLRPFWTGLLTARASMIERGRTVGLVECRVAGPDERLVAHATSTCMVLRGDAASGR